MSDDPRFAEFLKTRIGLDAASIGPALIERAVRLRCEVTSNGSLDQYWRVLNSDGEEQQALIESVVVPETWFFRYPESFVTLCKLALGRLNRQGQPLRILSLPCSTGEEPYSIAMALLDASVAGSGFRIDALDLSPLSIEKARTGLYGKNSFRGELGDFRNRYFSAEPGGYRINERVRAQVRLQTGNLLAPGLLAQEQPYDFVFCRNVLIYFDLETQARVFEVLKRLLRQDGVLFIGPAEGSLLGRQGMRSLGIAQSFAFGRDTETQAGKGRIALAALPETPPQALPAYRLPTLPAHPKPQVAPVKTEGAAQLLATIASLADQGRSAEARQMCQRVLQQHGPSAEAFYWLGLLAEVEGDRIDAQNCYRKALYLDPRHAEALVQLSALLAAQGDTVGARRLLDRAARQGREQ